MPQCAFLNERVAEFEAARRQYSELVEGLDPAAANRQPRRGKWSVAQNLAHLSLVNAGYFPLLEKSINGGRAKGQTGSAPFNRRSFVGGMLVSMMTSENVKKLKAPGKFQPKAATLDWGATQRQFEADLDRFIELANAADGLDLDRCRLPTPIAPWPKLTAAEAFSLHALHIPRHLDQAQRALDA